MKKKEADKKSNSLLLVELIQVFGRLLLISQSNFEALISRFRILERLLLISQSNSLLLVELIKDLRRVLMSSVQSQKEKECIDYIIAFSSKGQLKSKLWLVQSLKKLELSHLGQTFLCAGWCGSLAYLLLQDESFEVDQILNFDIDTLSIQISEDLNRKWVKDNWKFKASLKNILDLDYTLADFETLKKDGSSQRLQLSPDTIINTSCEHIENFTHWWEKMPKGKLIILQSNNFYALEEHINCVSSLKEFEKQAPMDLVLFRGELNLGEYTRFMLIGKK